MYVSKCYKLLPVFWFRTAEILSEILYDAMMSLNFLFLADACLINLDAA